MASTLKGPDFAREGAGWPHREASRFVDAAGLRWHVQQMGEGPSALLLHGTGGATHSWRGLAPLLARDFQVVAPDLPGHGFTSSRQPSDLSLPGMAGAVATLLRTLAVQPKLVVGHSAGAAILARLIADGVIAPELFVSVNGAFLPFEGWAGRLFPVTAKLLRLNPFAARMFAWSADPTAVANMLRGMGSKIDSRGVEFYSRLMRNPGHCAGALGMMANWDLRPLLADLPKVATPTVLIVGAGDKAVPPTDARKVAAILPSARIESLPGVGHLAHEEQPERVFALIAAHWDRISGKARERTDFA